MAKDLKKYSLIIVGLMFLSAIIYQNFKVKEYKNYKDDLYSESFGGILITKEDIQHDCYSLTVKTQSSLKELEMENAKQDLSKYSVGDSIIKLPNSYLFKVYRAKSVNGEREYVYKVGYTP
jgi:hypothetical protein